MPSKAALSFFVFIGVIFLSNCPETSAATPEKGSQGARFLESAPSANPDDAFHAALQASIQALQDDRFEAAEVSAKQAIALAEKMRPQDGRLPEAIGQLGSVYAARLEYKQAEESFLRQLNVAEKLYGAQHPVVTSALENLAMTALAQKDFATAEGYFLRALELNQQTNGENSTAVSDTLRGLAHIYSVQRDFAKSEAVLLRAVRIYEVLYGPEDVRVAVPLTSLCSIYDNWSKPDKSVACHARLIVLAEKQFGPNSQYLIRDLSAQAQALRQLGRANEALAVQQRAQNIQSNLLSLQ